jgi:wobble nucleotide-excising tRNase
LKSFGTELRLEDPSAKNPGGTDRTTVMYDVTLNGSVIDHQNKQDDKLRVEDVISDGDKTSFSLAFFLSKIEGLSDEELAESIIVIDDPISSFDLSRQHKTVTEIKEIAKKANQVIILSHDAIFLKKVQNEIKRDSHNKDLGLMEIKDKNIQDWGAQKLWRSKRIKNIETLESYLDSDGDSYTEAKSAIRIALEYNLETRFKSLRNVDNLGKMIGKINNNDVKEIESEGDVYKFLNRMNSFSTNSSHSGNSDDNNKKELKIYIREVLEYIRNPESVNKN